MTQTQPSAEPAVRVGERERLRMADYFLTWMHHTKVHIAEGHALDSRVQKTVCGRPISALAFRLVNIDDPSCKQCRRKGIPRYQDRQEAEDGVHPCTL